MLKRFAVAISITLAMMTSSVPVWAEQVQLPWKGIRLNGELTVPEVGSLENGVVLITHGSLAHNEMEIIVAIREALRERNIASLAISLGFNVDDRKGFYDCAVGVNTHKRHDAVDEIAAWVDWLNGQGAGPIAVMGHSAGGNQTAMYAAERLDPAVTAVILLAPGTYNSESQAASYKSRYGKDLSVLLERAGRMAPDALLEGVPFIRCETATVTAASFLSYYEPDASGDTAALAGAIAAPVLVIAGSKDNVVGDIAANFMPLVGDKLKFIMVEGADHFFLDLYMEDVADAVAEFLGERW